jgi:26S proteasome regulatory subunit N5
VKHVLSRYYPRSSFSFDISQGSDLKSTTRLVKAIIELEYDARDYAQLNSSINTLSKKHGQLKGAIQGMVELAMSWLDEIKQRDGIETWLELIETLADRNGGQGASLSAAPLSGFSVLTRSSSCSWRHRGLASPSPLPTTTKPCIETRSLKQRRPATR